MTTDLTDVRAKIIALRSRLKEAEARLARGETSCPHNHNSQYWSEPERHLRQTTEHVPDYGNPQTSGVHIDYPTRPVERSVPYWTRRCKLCGKVEETTATREIKTLVPRFGS